MKNIRDGIEEKFSQLGLLIYQHRYLALVFVLALTATLVLQLPKLSIDTSNDAFYHADDPIRVEYNEFRQQFGKDDHIFLGLNPDKIFDTTFLQTLEQLHQEIDQKVPHINKVTSLINVRNSYGLDDELVVEDLIESIPQTAEQLTALKQNAMSNPFYENYLLSSDGQFTFIDIEPDAVTIIKTSEPNSSVETKYVSTKEYAEMVDALLPILDKYATANLKIYAAGFPVITDRLARAIKQSMAELTPLTILLNLVFLTLLFRRFSGVVYPTVIVLITIVSTVGVMAWLSLPLDLVTTVLPTLLSVVAIADSVHLLSGFYLEYGRNGGDKKAAIAHSMGRNGLPILMTSLTTSVGLASFILADLAPIANLGLVAPIGILLAFIYTILLLPALIAIFPMKKIDNDFVINSTADKILDWITDVTCQRHKGIIVASVVVLVIGITGAVQLKLSHNSLTWLPEESKVRLDTSVIDKALGGSIPIEITIDTDKSLGLYDPDLINRLALSEEVVKDLGSESVGIGIASSLHLVIKEINKALHANNNAEYVIPKSRELIAQELLLFEISAAEDLRKLVDDDYSKVRFTVMVPFTDAIQIKPVVDRIRDHFISTYSDSKVTISGIGPMLVETMYDVITSMFKSYGFALIAITLLMIVLIGKLKIGLVSMAPNLIPIILVMGLMGWMGMPFDFSNMLVGSIAIGLVVDDTIHFLHNLRHHLDRTGNIRIAISDTLHSTGRAIFITSMVIVSGMAVAMTSDLNSTANFGLITATVIFCALLADFFLVPALMFAIYKNRAT